MSLSLLTPRELPELQEFFARLPLEVPPENLAQYSAPRAVEGGIQVATLVMRDGGRIIGSIGWIDVPLRINDDLGLARDDGRYRRLRWPVNLYLQADQRGKGLGKRLMEATREGASIRAVIGGNELSIPVLERTGFREAGRLVRVRWVRPCLNPAMLGVRFGGSQGDRDRPLPPGDSSWRYRGAVVHARRAPDASGWLPWADRETRGAPGEAGVPREAAYLEFAFGGSLAAYHARYLVDVNGALSGFFVLEARAGRRLSLAAEITDLDAVPGREDEVLDAARRTALACADIVRLRIAGGRFTRILARGARGITEDHALRLSWDEPATWAPRDWRLTYGDHDQYRVRAASARWRSR